MGRTFAALKNYQVDGNQEMMAIGVMNMAGSCSSCYVTTGDYPPPLAPGFGTYILVYTTLTLSCRVIFSICCKLQRWSANSGFEHNNGISRASDFVVSHAAVSLHSQFHLGSYHHNCCDWANRLRGRT